MWRRDIFFRVWRQLCLRRLPHLSSGHIPAQCGRRLLHPVLQRNLLFRHGRHLHQGLRRMQERLHHLDHRRFLRCQRLPLQRWLLLHVCNRLCGVLAWLIFHSLQQQQLHTLSAQHLRRLHHDHHHPKHAADMQLRHRRLQLARRIHSLLRQRRLLQGPHLRLHSLRARHLLQWRQSLRLRPVHQRLHHGRRKHLHRRLPMQPRLLSGRRVSVCTLPSRRHRYRQPHQLLLHRGQPAPDPLPFPKQQQRLPDRPQLKQRLPLHCRLLHRLQHGGGRLPALRSQCMVSWFKPALCVPHQHHLPAGQRQHFSLQLCPRIPAHWRPATGHDRRGL